MDRWFSESQEKRWLPSNRFLDLAFPNLCVSINLRQGLAQGDISVRVTCDDACMGSASVWRVAGTQQNTTRARIGYQFSYKDSMHYKTRSFQY